MAHILLCSFAVRVHDLQAYRKTDVPRECISLILEWRGMLMSFQMGFNLVNAAVVCAILESVSGFEPSPGTTEPRYLELLTVTSFCPFILISLLLLLVLSSVWSFWYRSSCHRLWRLCRYAQLILPFLLPLLLSHRCH